MQSISVYLYPNKIDVFTNASAPWLKERYRQVYQRNVKLYRGVDNRIDLQVRNSDEKAADSTGSTLVFNLVERESQKLILNKDCTVVDTTRGRFYVVIPSLDLDGIEPGFYQYSITQETRTDNGDNTYRVISRNPMYCDSQYGTLSTLEIFGSATGEPTDSIKVTTFALHDPAVTGVANPKYTLSSIIDARPRLSDPQTLHTFQFNFKNYQGTVMLQGSIDEGGTPFNWVDLEILDITPDQPVVYSNITGKWNFFRVKQNAYSGSNAQFVVQQTTLGNYAINVDNGGIGYKIGQSLTILGSHVGGVNGVNDITITVTNITGSGQIQSNGFRFSGVSVVGYKTFVVEGAGPLTVGSIDKVLYR